MLGCRDAEEVEVEGTKARAERNEKGSPTHSQPQASSNPLLNKDGSAICDWFLELLPCQDSTDGERVNKKLIIKTQRIHSPSLTMRSIND